MTQVHYPKIDPVPGEINRPLWSVMIPTYNGTKYLEQTLRSVLDQALEPEQMQIEVIDDCSTEDDPETLVKEVGQGRITFFRQPQNLGLIGSWNACIQRSYGQWVHILHQDDLVLPGFYQHLYTATQSSDLPKAAFCRHSFIDEDDHWQMLSRLEQRTSGVLSDWIQQIATAQLIQFPSIVVKREAYEQLGGFCFDAHYAADWEMWKRISAYYPVWYEPRILACYRQHSQSETSRLIRSGCNIADIRKAIELAASYLPPNDAKQLTQSAKEHYAHHALYVTRKFLAKNDLEAAIAQLQEAFRCSHSTQVLLSSLPLLRSIAKRWILQRYLRMSTL